MIRTLDRIAAALVLLIGLVHLGVGRMAFAAPTEPRIWFAAAGFLLVTTGVANLAAAAQGSRHSRTVTGAGPGRWPAMTALSGTLAILVLGALIAAADRALLFAPQTLVLLTLGILLTLVRLRELVRG